MHQQMSPVHQILDALTSVPNCRIEQLASLLPELTPSQLFREVQRLSQTGHVRLVLDGRGIVTVRSADQSRRRQAKKEEHPNGTSASRRSPADAQRTQ